MTGIVKVRLSGDPDDIRTVLALLATVADIAYDGRTYRQRGGFGVRAYAEVRAAQLKQQLEQLREVIWR
jgi:hypothetical protein